MQNPSLAPLPTRTYPRTYVIAALVLVLAWFGPLGYRDIAHPDEGRYSEIAREMVATGDWVTPRLDGLKYFEKPALEYWATAIAFELFGPSAFTARLWTALAGVLTVLIAGFTAGRRWGRKAGEYTALTLASMSGVVALAGIVTLDMTLTLFLTLALCAFLLASDARESPLQRRRWMWLVWAAMAGATLSKGLVGIVIPGATLVLYSALLRDFSFWKRLEWAWGPVIFLVLAAPWFVLVSVRNPEFPEFFFIHEHFTRFATTEHNRSGPLYYFVPMLLFFTLPWMSLLPQALRYATAPAPAHRPENRLLVIWSAFIFVFFSLSGSKLPPYILPMFPALALLLGQSLADAPAALLRPHARGLAVFWAAVGGLALVVAALAADPDKLQRVLHVKSPPSELDLAYARWLIAGGAIYAVLAWWAAAEAGRGSRDTAIVLLAASGVIGSAALVAGYQEYSPIKSARAIVAQVASQVTPDTELYAVREYDQTVPFYLGRTLTLVAFRGELDLGEQLEPDRWIPAMETFVQRWNAAPRAMAFTTRETMQQLAELGVPMKVLAEDQRHVVIAKP